GSELQAIDGCGARLSPYEGRAVAAAGVSPGGTAREGARVRGGVGPAAANVAATHAGGSRRRPVGRAGVAGVGDGASRELPGGRGFANGRERVEPASASGADCPGRDGLPPANAASGGANGDVVTNRNFRVDFSKARRCLYQTWANGQER